MSPRTDVTGQVLYHADPQIARWLWHPVVAGAAPKEQKKYAQFLDYWERQQRADERAAEAARENKTVRDWMAWGVVETWWFVRYTLLAPWLGK